MIKLPSIFSDNMVLQREKEIRIWGECDSNNITIKLVDEYDSHTNDDDINATNNSILVNITFDVAESYFEAVLPPLSAGGPYTLILCTDKDIIEYRNIMIGEVWIAGGQSNMELELQNSLDGKEVVRNINNPNVRFYYTPKVPWIGDELFEEEKNTTWELCKPDTSERWSAVGYYYADFLAKELGVTVGIIGCNWGGTSASCWTGRDMLLTEPEIYSYIEEYDEAYSKLDKDVYNKAYEEYIVYQSEFDKKVGLYYQTAENPNWDEAIRLFGESKYPGPMGPKNFTRPCGLYESMFKRIVPYSVKGVIFYQGEEDDHKPYTYKTLLRTMIKQWRMDLKDDKLPFIIAQLPGFLGESDEDLMNWPFIREAQADIAKEVENVSVASLLDLGNKKDIHPLNKKDVGYRMSILALCDYYKKINPEKAYAACFSGCEFENNKVYISFENESGSFVVVGDSIKGFEVAGEDCIYKKANAFTMGDKIVAYSDEAPNPCYVRYAWNNYQDVNLYSENMLPVMPFRSSREDKARAIGSRNGLKQ